MEDFIKKIFDIDRNVEEYQKSYELEKQKLIDDKKNRIRAIDDEYLMILEKERKKLDLHISSLENEDMKKLEEYIEKSKVIKDIFKDRKENLIKYFANSILESGDFCGK